MRRFVVETHHDGVLAGSSNLTYAGLRTNVELNLGQQQPHVVGEVMGWYDELWDEAVDYDLADLYEQRFAAWDPYVVFLRMLWHHPNDYAMVVIDEPHAYRNTDTDRSATLRQLLKGAPQKQLVLLTATPVNNSLWDLYNLLAYFIRNDAKFLESGIPSLRNHFAAAAAEDPDDLTPERLFDVLDAVAVRRTRRFVKKFYPHATIHKDGQAVPIAFPQPVVHRVDYDLDAVLPGFFAQFAHDIRNARRTATPTSTGAELQT